MSLMAQAVALMTPDVIVADSKQWEHHTQSTCSNAAYTGVYEKN